jgi:O-antigen/teichoic acid export membrane protein
MQQFGLVVGILAGIASTTIGLVLWFTRRDDLADAGLLLASFGPAILTACVFGALGQAYIARNRFGTVALISNLSIGGGAVVSVFAVMWMGNFGFAVTEIIVNITGISVLLLLWRVQKDPQSDGV